MPRILGVPSRSALASASVFMVLALVAGCTGSELTDPGATGGHSFLDTAKRAVPSGAMLVTPDSATVSAYQNIKFTALSRSSSGDTVVVSVDWTASGGTITSDGLFSSTTAGTYSVLAKTRGRYRKTASSTVIVMPTEPTVVKLSISPHSASLAPGAKRTFVAAGTLTDSSTVPVGVSWAATGGTVDASGTYSAGSTPGSYWVAAANAGSGLTDTVAVTITSAPVALRAVVLTPSSATLAPGGTKAFTAVGLMSDSSTATIPIDYSATGGTVTAGGSYTAGGTPGSYRVIAADTSGTLTDTAVVTITAPAPTLSAIVLTPATASVQTGGTQQFSATGRMSDGSSVSVTAAFTATGGTISGAGLYTAGQLGGTYRAIAVANGKADTATVTVTAPAPPPPPPSSGGCEGIAVAAGASIQAAVNAQPTGATFCLGAGTFARQTVTPKASQRFIGARSGSTRLTILDGQNATVSAFNGSAANVRVEGLKVTGYYGGSGTETSGLSVAIFSNGSTGWVVYDNEVSYNTGAGIAITNGAIIRKNDVHHNGWLGMSCGGGNGNGAVVDSNEVSWNNTRGIDPNWGAGGIKCVPASDVTFRANHVTHNAGYGIWCDNCGGTIWYLANRVDSNSHSGIYHEVSAAAVIDGNTLIGNGASNRGGIWVDNSANVEVRNNIVSGAPNGLILLRQVSRPDLPSRLLTNAYVHDNSVTVGSGFVGLVQYVGDNSYFTSKGNRFDRNTYSALPSVPFRWNNANLTLAQWNAAGQD